MKKQVIDLLQCFPEPPPGKQRGPLPKQKLFLDHALNPAGPKYIRYCGGIGSGKTLIGAVTMLTWAITQPGTYLVCRQFLPELKITTLQAFLDICPPELIAEHRVADGIIKIKSQGGKTSSIIFRGLEEPDKHRSLNLSGFWIDESSQVSEAAFILLQGRLRGNGLRKGILTTNSAGHDWQWRWFIKQDMFTNPELRRLFVNIKAPSTENVHLPEGYVETMLGSWSEEKIKREIYADEDSFEGQVYHEFRHDLHIVKPFVIPDHWPRYIGIDHGYRNPSAWIYGTMDFDGNLYIYKEFYKKEQLIEDICKDNMKLMQKPGTSPAVHERIEWAKIDPSTKAQRNERGGVKLSDFDLYMENLPADFPMGIANNDVTAGIDKVKGYFKPDQKTGRPRIFIFSHCKDLIEELGKYRYSELTAAQQGRKNEKEAPVKVDDHACDALRYLVMGLPEAASQAADVYDKIKYNSLEGQLHRDLNSMRSPKQNSDPFGI